MEISRVDVVTLLREFDASDNVDALDRALTIIDSIDADSNAPKAQALASRSEKLQLLLAAFNHIDRKLVPGFDSEDLPLINTIPPPESGLPPGVDPKSIKDPGMRAEYEREISANQAKSKVYNFQSSLHKVDQRYLAAFQRHISKYPKASADALRKSIDETVDSNERKALLKDEVSTLFGSPR